ncbi:uncharacterized protein LOC129767144 [Toxorhynchites rutilus septentrionalis]|uniref:uncharacterized protein LOC129767144 n=1 Tax=Toxorhynchites rutilus septentrionalis TaxID=329112 RepID=UPI00247A4DC4|nr:uncharacterized protein LOC129767144 [Toxorhynchites rutilus septentrionalis]
MDNASQVVDLLDEVHHLRFTAERDVLNAWKTYNVSERTRQLLSEAGRVIYAEAISFDGSEGSKTHFPKSLATLAVECLAQAFQGGSVPDALTCQQQRDFGGMLDVDLPILQLLEVDNELFWKRVARTKIRRFGDFLELERDKHFHWKPIGIELKVAEAISGEDPTYWFEGCLEDILIKSAPFVKKLIVAHLQHSKTVELAEGYEGYKLYNVPSELSHHGSLKVLRHLQNLTSLSLTFGPEDRCKQYQRRFFQCSLEDMENLAEALGKLQFLEHFKISKSRLSPEKLKVLLNQLALKQLKVLEFPYCNLSDDTGIHLGKYISKCPPCLHTVNLSGNFLSGKEIENFGYGIYVYEGILDRLDISYNPVGEAGILTLGGAVKKSKHLRELNVSVCDIGEQGALRVAQLLGFHRPLEVLLMDCVPLGKTGGKKLIQVLKENWFVQEVHCKSCGLKESQEERVKKILRRNNKFIRSQRISSTCGASEPTNAESEPQ